MARKKTVKVGIPGEISQQASKDVAVELANAFDDFTMDKYGMLNPPAPYVTPTGIKPLDAILGGGFSSSMPIAFSSTPESRFAGFYKEIRFYIVACRQKCKNRGRIIDYKI